MRAIVSIAIIGGIIAIFFFRTESEPPRGKKNAPTPITKTAEDKPGDRRIAADRVEPAPITKKAPTAAADTNKADAGEAAQPTEQAEAPKGPFTIDLGQHTIQLRDDSRKRAVRFKLQLVTQTDETRTEIRRRRRDLVRMTYFLGSKRQADGVLGNTGKSRFENDLLERFQNVVRTGSIDELKLIDYQIISRAKDAGVDE